MIIPIIPIICTKYAVSDIPDNPYMGVEAIFKAHTTFGVGVSDLIVAKVNADD